MTSYMNSPLLLINYDKQLVENLNSQECKAQSKAWAFTGC